MTTPILASKAKEKLKHFIADVILFYQVESMLPTKQRPTSEIVDELMTTPVAAAILSGEDWKEDGGLLRECAMRCHLAFPETEQDLKWFDEGLKHQDRFHLALGKALDLGNMELQQVQYDSGVKEQEESIKAIDNLPKPDFDKMMNRIINGNKHLPPVGIYHAFYNGDHVLFQVYDGGFRVINYHGEKNDSPKLNLIKWLPEPPKP